MEGFSKLEVFLFPVAVGIVQATTLSLLDAHAVRVLHGARGAETALDTHSNAGRGLIDANTLAGLRAGAAALFENLAVFANDIWGWVALAELTAVFVFGESVRAVHSTLHRFAKVFGRVTALADGASVLHLEAKATQPPAFNWLTGLFWAGVAVASLTSVLVSSPAVLAARQTAVGWGASCFACHLFIATALTSLIAHTKGVTQPVVFVLAVAVGVIQTTAVSFLHARVVRVQHGVSGAVASRVALVGASHRLSDAEDFASRRAGRPATLVLLAVRAFRFFRDGVAVTRLATILVSRPAVLAAGKTAVGWGTGCHTLMAAAVGAAFFARAAWAVRDTGIRADAKGSLLEYRTLQLAN